MNARSRPVPRTARTLAAGLLLVGLSALLPPAGAEKGAPDSYGYAWVDSLPPSPTIIFNWIDGVAGGTRLTLNDDDCTFEVNLGFQFRFYGTITDYLYVCSNGFVTFEVPDSFQAEPPIPSTASPNNRVVGLGMDLDPAASGSGGVYIRSFPASSPKRFVITWDGVYKVFTTKRETFQIVLEQNQTTRDGRILFQYRAVQDVTGALVGIENRTGTSGLAYPKPVGDGLAVAFLPPSDAGLPPDTLLVSPAILAPFAVAQGTLNVPMLRLNLSAASNSLAVTGVRVQLSGTRPSSADVPRARLWLDGDGDGAFTLGPDPFLDAGDFLGTPPMARLEPISSVPVSVNADVSVFVTFDIAPTAAVGAYLGAHLPDFSFLSVVFPDIVSNQNFPIETFMPGVQTRIEASQDILQLTQARPLAPATVPQWGTDVRLLSMTFLANQNVVDLVGLRAFLGGNVTGSDAWLVKAIHDRNADGNYTPSVDAVLSVVTPESAPPYANLSFSLSVGSGGAERILLLLDVAPEAQLGRSFDVSVGLSDIFLAPGSPDSIANVNFPALAGNATIVPGTRPTLPLPFEAIPPRIDGVWAPTEYQAGPVNTISLVRPAGNRVPGFLVAENTMTSLHLAVAAVLDVTAGPADGVTVGFDVDRDEVETGGTDDVLALNATAGMRYAFNTSAGAWTALGPCTAVTSPACATGVGSTPFGPGAHRIYEFAIPLAILNATPGSPLRLALAPAPTFGLADEGNRSTWPLVFDATAPALRHYGEVLLAPGPLPNRPPTLNWTGEPGYEADGLEPESGLEDGTFAFSVLYADPDNDAPTYGEPHLHLLRDGLSWAGSPFRMEPVDAADEVYADGRAYRFDVVGMPCGGNYTYFFAAEDLRRLPANNTPIRTGPLVVCPDRPPSLGGDAVSPLVGTAGQTNFTYRIAYRDPEGRAPTWIVLHIERDGVEVGSPGLSLVGWIGPVDDYVAGAWFAGGTVIGTPGTNYTYRFEASDGNSTMETGRVLGPYVLSPPPDVLSVYHVDLVSSFTVDEGAVDVPFLALLLFTSAEVNVTSIRFDRSGTAVDSEVVSANLYHDMDGDYTVTANDTRIGSQPILLGMANFAVSLTVTGGAPVSLILTADLARPGTSDATLGFELADTSYVQVGSGDRVASFSGYRSTRVLINTRPDATDPTVEGHGMESIGIQHIVAGIPTFAWGFSDANGADVVQVRSNVSVFVPGSPPILLWSLNRTGGGTTLAYGGPPLADGRDYLLTVAVSDGRLWSEPAPVSFRMNTPPPAPLLLTPGDGAVGLGPLVTLVWQTVTDAEGDPIVYEYWVSDNPGFFPSQRGTALVAAVTMNLLAATTYYWKVGASDGFEFAGNASVWQFTTVGGPGAPGGSVRGRVLNGTTPLPEALVQVLVGGSVAIANLTDANGSFVFRSLAFRAYTIRISAPDFQSATRSAQPTLAVPDVDLGDVSLAPYRPPTDGDGTGSGGNVSLPLALLGFFFVAALVLTVFMLLLPRRRRAPEEGVVHTKQPVPRVESAAAPPSPTFVFECPACGRTVAEHATRCECGAEFEDASSVDTI